MKKICKNCGYINVGETKPCPICQKSDWEDYNIYQIKKISTDEAFVQAMIKLHNEDPIEFQLKMSQFKTQPQQQESVRHTKEQDSSTKLTCPKCGSTNITEGTKGFSLMTGFIGSGNFRYVCKKCGNKWKPGSMLETLQRANNKT